VCVGTRTRSSGRGSDANKQSCLPRLLVFSDHQVWRHGNCLLVLLFFCYIPVTVSSIININLDMFGHTDFGEESFVQQVQPPGYFCFTVTTLSRVPPCSVAA
jgi:hypothetical protein